MDVIHVRAVSPSELTDQLVGRLADDPSVLDLIVLRGPRATPAATPSCATYSDGSRQLGPLVHAPAREQVEAHIRAEGRYTPSFYLCLVVAGLIGAVGIVTNSRILA